MGQVDDGEQGKYTRENIELDYAELLRAYLDPNDPNHKEAKKKMELDTDMEQSN